MEFVPTLALAALVMSLINFGKYVRGADWNGAGTQLVAWAAGVLAVILTAATDWADGIEVGGQALSSLNAASLILIGLTIASTGSLLTEFKKALDGSDSAAKPDLFR